QRALHTAEQRLPRGIQHEAPAATLEHVESQMLLEAADLLTHRAVRQVQYVGGGAHVGELGDRAKRGQRVERQARRMRHSAVWRIGKLSLPEWSKQIDS